MIVINERLISNALSVDNNGFRLEAAHSCLKITLSTLDWFDNTFGILKSGP